LSCSVADRMDASLEPLALMKIKMLKPVRGPFRSDAGVWPRTMRAQTRGQRHRHALGKRPWPDHPLYPLRPGDRARRGRARPARHGPLGLPRSAPSFSGLRRVRRAGHLRGSPGVEQMRRPIHGRRKAPPIKARCLAPALHALDDKDVLFEDLFPLGRVARAQGSIGFRRGIVNMYMLDRARLVDGLQDDGIGMIAVHPKQHVGERQRYTRRPYPTCR